MSGGSNPNESSITPVGMQLARLSQVVGDILNIIGIITNASNRPFWTSSVCSLSFGLFPTAVLFSANSLDDPDNTHVIRDRCAMVCLLGQVISSVVGAHVAGGFGSSLLAGGVVLSGFLPADMLLGGITRMIDRDLSRGIMENSVPSDSEIAPLRMNSRSSRNSDASWLRTVLASSSSGFVQAPGSVPSASSTTSPSDAVVDIPKPETPPPLYAEGGDLPASPQP